jgi:hypothetical protein
MQDILFQISTVQYGTSVNYFKYCVPELYIKPHNFSFESFFQMCHDQCSGSVIFSLVGSEPWNHIRTTMSVSFGWELLAMFFPSTF